MAATDAPIETLLAALQSASSSEEALEVLERALVPDLADWCVVYLRRQDATLEPVAAAHRDADLTATILEKSRAYPPETTDTVGAGAVARSGQAELLADIPEALLPALCRDEEHTALMRQLGLRSSLTVPISFEDRCIGVLRLGKGEAGFTANDLGPVQRIAAALGQHSELERVRQELHRERRERRVAQVGQLRYRAIMEANPMSTQILSSEGRTLEVNRAWEEFWGIRLEDDPSYHTPLFDNEQLRETGVMEFFSRALRGERLVGPPTLYDTGQHTEGGQARWIRSRATPVQGAGGKVREVIIVHEELSAPEQSEAANRLRALGLRLPNLPGHTVHGDDPLSPRERAVLHLIAEGRSNKEIAKVLSVSENTAKFHVTGVFNKLGVNSRAMAVSHAVQRGLL